MTPDTQTWSTCVPSMETWVLLHLVALVVSLLVHPQDHQVDQPMGLLVLWGLKGKGQDF